MLDLPDYVRELRLDVRELRIDNSRLIRSIKQHRKKSERLLEENERLRRINDHLHKENNLLKEEIEKLTKTNNRYQVALFDHGNFKHHASSEKKPKGGQIGHSDTNRESHEDYSSYEKKRLFVTHCIRCGGQLKRAPSTKEKLLIDIVINPEVIKCILESERQWCPTCNMEVNAKDSQALPFTEYGLNTFMIILLLKFRCHTSLSTISKLLAIFFGLNLSKSVVVNILFAARQYLQGKYDDLLKEVRAGNVMYNDETGWQVRGKSAWMWIAVNANTTIYFAGESRGGGIAKEIYGNSNSYSMHDGYRGYREIPSERNLFCWSHILRFSFEETINSPPKSDAAKLRDGLLKTFCLKKDNPNWSKEKLKEELIRRINKLSAKNSNEGSFIKIYQRLQVQKDGLIKALLLTPDGTNNLSERELRPMVITRKISYGSDTYAGMQASAILTSVVRTAERRTDEKQLLPVLENWLKQGVKKKFPKHAYL